MTTPKNSAAAADAQARRDALETGQMIADGEQTAAEADQTAADSDQTGSDEDQETSDRDGALSASDQESADTDQETADREATATNGHSVHEEAKRARDKTRAQRVEARSGRERDAETRAQTTAERFSAAARRDEAAQSRDLACEARDLAAAARDRLIAAAERSAGDERLSTAPTRRRAAADRLRAAQDRRQAADDREQARLDREHLHTEIAASHLDDLTGSYRRRMGAIALQAEVDRARRSTGRLALAFIDVDDLKGHNDRDGHAAGDALLVSVVTCIRSHLRSYDPVVRFGGDEFVCALANADLDHARRRFRRIEAALRLAHPGASISTGFAELRPEETLEDLLNRGDAALYAMKEATRIAAS